MEFPTQAEDLIHSRRKDIDDMPSMQNREATHPALARFMDDFRFTLASSPEEKRRTYRLRHDIYCVELEYEAPADKQNHLEYDVYDQLAIHCLIEHRRTGLIAACTRLVMPHPGGPSPLDRLPLETYGGRSLTHPELHPRMLPSDSYYEISRLAVSRVFRTKAREVGIAGYEFTPEEQETFSLLVTGLFLAGYALGCMSGKSIAFAMMEPSLTRLLSRSGFHFTKVGDTIDFHGTRSAYCINRKQAETGMHRTLYPLYRYIQEELGPQLTTAAPSTGHSSPPTPAIQ